MRRGKQFVVRRLDEYYYDLVRRDGPPGVSAVQLYKKESVLRASSATRGDVPI